MNEAVAAKLQQHQAALYEQVLANLQQAGSVRNAAQAFAGAKALIEAFVALGLPRTLESDEYLRALIYGGQGLITETPDQPYLSQIWLQAIEAPPAHNVRIDAQALITSRAEALSDVLDHYLDKIDAGQYGESHRMIETTLDRLKIAKLMINKPALSLSAGEANFGEHNVGAPAAARMISLSNAGLAKSINNLAITLTGSNAADFSLASDCGSSLAAGASCTVTVSFEPGALGERSAVLRIASSAPGAPHNLPLSGNGTLEAILVAPATVNEDSPIELTLRNPADPDNESPWGPGYSYAFDCGAGYGAFGSATSTNCPTEDDGERTLRAKIKDGSGQAIELSTSVNVANVAPSATLSAPASGDEGGSIALALNDASDPSSADSAAGLEFAFDCGAGFGEFGPNNSVNCPLPDSGAYSVRAQVRDKDGGVSEYSASVNAANIAPVGSLRAPATVNEGTSIALAITDVSDPSSADLADLQYAFDCGTGYGEFGPSSSANCPTDDNGERTVRAQIRDKDGGLSEYSASVSVINVAPSAILHAPTSVNEGSPIALSLTHIEDPSSVDRPSLQFAFDCGAGYGEFGSSRNINCPTDDNGERTVRAQVRDKDGGLSEYSAVVSIKNIAPTADLRVYGPFYTGRVLTVELAEPRDAPADRASLEFAFDCGDGKGFGPYSQVNQTGCTGLSAGQLIVKGRIRDKDGLFSEYSTRVYVENALAITALSPANGEEFNLNTPVKLKVVFSDAEPKDGYICRINWGDGSGWEEGAVTDLGDGGICEAAYFYPKQGDYQIQIELLSGPSDTATTTIGVRIYTMEK